ncbi:prenyltransferase/squalene oxidase repeat-containing protein [Nocardioides sp.]|uniref:prenyltransferase/squalene oxidase repeat-containing protein n=1 Tax=Nocardioides sp. TaxID=35761 RepID=UPI0039E2B5F4
MVSTSRRATAICAGLATAVLGLVSTVGIDRAAADATSFVTDAATYLVSPANLVDGTHYEPFVPGSADYGLTIDGALALAAVGGRDETLAAITDYVAANSSDYTYLGTEYAEYTSGGAVAKVALLAEATGHDPRSFGDQDLIAALDALVCTAAGDSCAAAGAYSYGSSTFSQALGVIAQLRAGETEAAAAPVDYLSSLQQASGAWPSLLPSSGDADVDSTAMAVMALDLVDSDAARQAVAQGLAWIAGQQNADGSFDTTYVPGSTNSTGLAIQAMSLEEATYADQVSAGRDYLVSLQDADGGVPVSPSQSGSDVRATTQALGGYVGTSFGTLLDDVTGTDTSTDTAPTTGAADTASSALPVLTLAKAPVVKGKAKVGKVLKVMVSIPQGATVTYQWLAGGKPIKPAKKSAKRTLKLTEKLRGKRIAVRVTVALTGYSPYVTVVKAKGGKVKR